MLDIELLLVWRG